MPLHIRTYHELTEPDRSGLGDQIAAQRRRLAERLAAVGRVIVVMSGKGGVGKSFVTANLARALARGGRAVGVLDADLNGPTVARLLEVADARLTAEGDTFLPASGADGVRVVSMAQLLADGQPLAFKGPAAESFVWRGAAEAGALRELLADIAWGTLDILLPAPPAVLTVTIPTPESRDAVRRAMRAAVERRAPLLGVVENMVGGPFGGTAGADLAEEFETVVLARIPWHPIPDTWHLLATRL